MKLLPISMPGLVQIYSADQNDGVSTVTKWIKDNHLEDIDICIMSKMDGQSILHISNYKGISIAFSKSELDKGKDITRHIKKMVKVPTVWTMSDENVAVRAESIIEYGLFTDVQASLKAKGKNYKNARNFVAGMNNSTESCEEFYKHADLVAYEIMNSNLSKSEQLIKLESLGWKIPDFWVVKGDTITDESLQAYIIKAKALSKFELDGVVLTVDDVKVCKKMGFDSNGHAECSRKFKVAGSDNEATTEVVNVLWRPSKQGYAKPRVQIKPVDLAGVTITYVTGFNAKTIEEEGIGPGAIIKITRAGDVIPKIIFPAIKRATPKLPDKEFGEVYWSDEHVDLILVNTEENDEVKLYSMLDAFGRLEVIGLREASCQKLYDAGYNTVAKVIKAPKQAFINTIGDANGNKIYDSLHEKLMNVSPAVLAAASQCFGRGIGVRKMNKLLQTYGEIRGLSYDQIYSTDSFSDITATLVSEGLPKYEEFLKDINGLFAFEHKEKVMGGDLEGKIFVFTGYRNKDAESEIEARGGKIGSGISKLTTYLVLKDINSKSSKAVKARDLGVSLLSPDDLSILLK
jgi:DNA ligase (NAD+)